MKKFLVKFTCRSGEYEFSSHTVLTLKPRQRITAQVHNYFMEFYGKENTCKKDCEKGVSYLYNMGEVGVDHISWREISEADVEVLSKLGL